MKYAIGIAALALLLLGSPAHAQEPLKPVTHYNVVASTTLATAARTIGDYIDHVRVMCSASCYVGFAASPFANTAVSAPVVLPANIPETIRVAPGSIVGVHLEADGGRLWITEMSK